MFVIEFKGTTRIKKIQVLGRYLGINLLADEADEFIKHYSLEASCFDDEENSDRCYVSLLLPTQANQENLSTFLAIFQDQDLSKAHKEKFLELFQELKKDQSKDHLGYLILQYIDLLSINPTEESDIQFYQKNMPVFISYLSQFRLLTEDPSWPAMINIEGKKVDFQQAIRAYSLFSIHVRNILIPLYEYLVNFAEVPESRSQLFENLSRLFHKASNTPFPNFKSLSPSLHKELKNTLPFLSEKLNNLYWMLAEHFSVLLGKNVQYIPQIFPHPKTNNYLIVDSEKKIIHNYTPEYQKLNTVPLNGEESKSNKLDKENLNLLLSPVEKKGISNKLSPQKTKQRNRETPEKMHKIKLVEANDYIKAINILKKIKKGQSIIDVMKRLKEGEQSYNPYWINSGLKLQAIIATILNLNSRGELNIKNECLEQVLNMPRLLPLTFLGKFGINHAKSAMMVELEYNDDEQTSCSCIF